MDLKFMHEAIRLSIENKEKRGGPFGAVIVKDGKIILIMKSIENGCYNYCDHCNSRYALLSPIFIGTGGISSI